jgi:DNA primase
MNYQQNVKKRLYNWFTSRMGMWDYTRGWLKGDCPYCHKQNKFGVHLTTNRTNCFSCGEHPYPINVVMEIEGYATFVEAHKHILSLEEVEYLEPPSKILKQKQVDLPESYTLISLGKSRMGKMARSALKKRGFKINELSYKGVGYCTTGPYWGRIIIPFYQQGKLIYFNARTFVPSSNKFKNPSMSELGIGKSLLIYNVDALSVFKEVSIVESATNALTLGDNATSTGGKFVSDYQLSTYIESPVKKFVIIMDPDAHHEALWTGLKLVDHKKVKVVLLPGETEDINDLGRKKTKKFIKQTPWMGYKDIMKLYIQHPKKTNR